MFEFLKIKYSDTRLKVPNSSKLNFLLVPIFYIILTSNIKGNVLITFQIIISANAELKKYFSKCRDGKIRLLKVSIENGEI